MPALLAVDLGLRTGLAKYLETGRLAWYRSHHFANRQTLRRAIHGLLDAEPDLSHIVIEGGGPLAVAWVRQAERRCLPIDTIAAETWRRDLFRTASPDARDDAKLAADRLARRVIEWSGARRPPSLRHDTAEAILIGFWKVRQLGWTRNLPPDLQPARP